MGDVEAVLAGAAESMVRYHSFRARVLTFTRYPGSGQYQVGSLTGAVASQKVTEACEGRLRTVRNRS